MALVPKISICINSKCNSVDIYEETSPYVLATNAGGWVNSGTVATNIDTSEITDAKLEIYDSAGDNILDTIILYDGVTDVYSGVNGAPAPGAFLAIDNYTWTLADGIFKLQYTVTDGNTIFTNDLQHILHTCNINNCIDDLKAKIVTECDAVKLSQQKEQLDQLEVILYGIKSAFSCADFTSAEALIISAQAICDNICDCGCGDC
jgi:hypothetical protein